MITSRFSSAGSCEVRRFGLARRPSAVPTSGPAGLATELQAPRITVDSGAGRLGVFSIPVGWTRIGRSRSCALQLEDRSVSRRHALLIRTPDEDDLRVIDDRSLSGVLVNGKPVCWAALTDGDRIGIGCFELTVAFSEAVTPAATRAS